MSNKVKDKDIKKKCTYYFFNDRIHKESFNPTNTKIDERSCKNIFF